LPHLSLDLHASKGNKRTDGPGGKKSFAFIVRKNCDFIRANVFVTVHLFSLCLTTNGAPEASVFTMQFRTVLDVKVVDVEKRRNPSKHYVSWLPIHLASFSNLMLEIGRRRKTHLDHEKEHFCKIRQEYVLG